MNLPYHASGERDLITMRTMTVVRQYLAAAFLVVIGLIAYGCGDSATVNPVVELASLTVDPGTLQPAFSGGTTQYNVDVSNNITSVTITAQPAVAGDTVTINGQTTTSSVINLGAAGTTTPVNIVVSETGTNSRTYTVLLIRAGLTGNNSLQNLTLSSGTLDPPFTANELNYSLDVANNVGNVTVTPTLSDPAATMTVNGQATNSGQARTIPLNGGGQSTAITIAVTAQNGNPKTYLVTVSRGVSSNNNIQGLTVSPGNLAPSFRADRTGYTVNVGSSVASITVTPRLQDTTTATMTVNGQGTNSGQTRTIPLGAAGSNTPIFIIVTAQNGTQKTYTVGVNRDGGNNNLSALTVSPGSLDSPFNANDLNYTVGVGSTVASITVTEWASRHFRSRPFHSVEWGGIEYSYQYPSDRSQRQSENLHGKRQSGRPWRKQQPVELDRLAGPADTRLYCNHDKLYGGRGKCRNQRLGEWASRHFRSRPFHSVEWGGIEYSYQYPSDRSQWPSEDLHGKRQSSRPWRKQQPIGIECIAGPLGPIL